MIQAILTVKFTTLEESLDSSATRVCRGAVEIENYHGKETINWRARGSVTMEMKMNTYGVAVGFLDIVDVQRDRDSYKEKVTTLVIQKFIPISSSSDSETELVSSGYGPKVELEF